MKEITAEILITGDEVLSGRIADTNAVFLSRRLLELGVNPVFRTTVGDHDARFREVIEKALSRADIVIVTGGLGPTDDDLTREACSRVLQKRLVRDEEAARHVEKILKRYGIRCEESEMRQAFIPEGAVSIPNRNGTAYGFCCETRDGKMLAALSGVPSEMEQMFEDGLVGAISDNFGELTPRTIRILRFFGVSESGLQKVLRPVTGKYSELSWGITSSQMVLTLSLAAQNEDEKDIESAVGEIREAFGDKLFSTEGENLEEALARLLWENKLTIALAESCTGGLATHLLTHVPGVSENLIEGVVTYSNDAKIRRLGIQKETLEKYGAVSEQTAARMSSGILESSGADIGVGITGIAGPSGGTSEKPVGLVYISVKAGGEHWTREFKFTGSRTDIQKRAANCALNMARLAIIRDF